MHGFEGRQVGADIGVLAGARVLEKADAVLLVELFAAAEGMRTLYYRPAAYFGCGTILEGPLSLARLAGAKPRCSKRDLCPVLRSDNLREATWVCRDHGHIVRCEAVRERLGRDDHIDVEGLRISRWLSIPPCFRPEAGGKSKRIVRERKVASGRGCDKSVKPRDSETLACPEQLAFQFVVKRWPALRRFAADR